MTFLLVATFVVLLFGFVLLYGAPYLPTFKREANIALDLLNLKKGQTLYELGCGDGRVMSLAAQRGINVVGYELNPILVLIAWLRTFRYRRQVRVIWGNFWKADLTPADGVFVFLIDGFMEKLDQKMLGAKGKKRKLVSYAFQVPDKKVIKTKAAMFLYHY